MKKIDFRKIPVRDIEGNEVTADIAKELGNTLYMQGMNIEECELGSDIYHKGEVELTPEQCNVIRRFTQGYGYVLRRAVHQLLGD